MNQYDTYLNNAIDLLEQDQRNEEDVKVIMKGTRHLKFFQELLQSKNKHRLHYLTCKYMTIKSYCQGDIIFKENDIPDNFYIILRGTANVYCKKKFMNIEQQQVMGEYNSLDEAKRKYHIVELLQKMKKFNLQPKLIEKMRLNKSYANFIKETGGLLPEQFDDYDYFFEGGVFTQNLIVQLQQGDIFGELGLLLGQKRSATVLAHTDIKLAIICKEDYQNILQADQFRKIHKKLNFLYNNFFLNMPNQLTTQYAYDFKKQKLPNGFVMYKQGQKADSLFIIKHGEVDIQILQPDGFQLKVSKLGEGQIFGETEFFKKTNRQSSAVVVSEFVKILSLQYYVFNHNHFFQQFEKALEQLPQLMENFQNKLIQKDNFIEKQKQRTISIKLKTEPTKQTQVQVDSEFQNYCSNDLISKIKFKIQQYKDIGLIPSQQQVTKYQQEFNKSLADIQQEQKQFTKIALTRPNLIPFNEQVKLKRSQQSSILLRSVINPSDSSLVDRKDVLSYQFSIDQQHKLSRMESKMDLTTSLSKVRSESNLSVSPQKNILIQSKHNMFRKMPTRNFLLMKLQYRRNKPS